jgi:hypothetical protein
MILGEEIEEKEIKKIKETKDLIDSLVTEYDKALNELAK